MRFLRLIGFVLLLRASPRAVRRKPNRYIKAARR